jgi:hypothetical protein
MTTIFGMMAMVPVLFASAGYVLVSSDRTAEHKDYQAGLAETAGRSRFFKYSRSVSSFGARN